MNDFLVNDSFIKEFNLEEFSLMNSLLIFLVTILSNKL